MSLSRIIKSGCSVGQPVADFCFSSFQKGPEQVFQRNSDGFTPFLYDSACSPPEDDEEEFFAEETAAEEVEICGMIRIPEEELQKKLNEAFEKGAEEERKQADEDLAGICSALSEAISVVSRLKERIVRECEEDLLKLAFQVAKKIVRQEIRHDRRILAQLVSEALKGFPEQHDIVVSLHPEDYKVINSNRELFMAGINDERQLTLKPDDSTTLGGCIVESSNGVIDARIEAQLDEIYKGLIEERNRLGDVAEQATALTMPDEELTP